LKTEWRLFDSQAINEYRNLLKGDLPVPRKGLKIQGRFERLRHKSIGIRINLFDWYQFSRSKATQDLFSVSINAVGDIVFEQRLMLEKSKISGNEIDLFRILYETQSGSNKLSDSHIWSYQRKRIFSQKELRKFLLVLLRIQAIAEYDLPAAKVFPSELNVIWLTEFSGDAMEEIKSTTRGEKRNALIRAYELLGDRDLGKENYLRDWMINKELRELVKNDPVGAHLKSKYPIPGRTESQRRFVVFQYRTVLSFLEIMDNWKKNGKTDIRDCIKNGLDIPVFACFHLLSSGLNRQSAVAVTGAFNRMWGDKNLLE
jgi:hypothetical protein